MRTCECGGAIIDGYMYGERFVAGTTDLHWSFRGNESLLKSWFPDGIPDRGERAEKCSKCGRAFALTE